MKHRKPDIADKLAALYICGVGQSWAQPARERESMARRIRSAIRRAAKDGWESRKRLDGVNDPLKRVSIRCDFWEKYRAK